MPRHRLAHMGDGDLVTMSRSGDTSAFGELWNRHYRSGLAAARSITSSIDADDLVQESYTRIFQAIRRGGGPRGAFRAYLFATIRNTAATWGSQAHHISMENLEVIDPRTMDEAMVAHIDRGLVDIAFRSLPLRWQEVLWYTEVERLKPAKIAPLLGMKSVAVAQLAFRARNGLRDAWIAAHLKTLEDGSECQWTVEHLAAFVRRSASRRDHAKVESHLAACSTCRAVSLEAKEASSRLAVIVLPFAIGTAAASGYRAILDGGTPAAAAATVPAMPAGVVGGTTVLAEGGSVAAVAWSLVAAGTAIAAGAGLVITMSPSPEPPSAAVSQVYAEASTSPTIAATVVKPPPTLVSSPSPSELPASPAPDNSTPTTPDHTAPPSNALVLRPTPAPTLPPDPTAPPDPTSPPEPEVPVATAPALSAITLDGNNIAGTISGSDGRVVALYVDGLRLNSWTVSNGVATFYALGSIPFDNREIYFRYEDGGLEQSDTRTGDEWNTVVNG